MTTNLFVKVRLAKVRLAKLGWSVLERCQIIRWRVYNRLLSTAQLINENETAGITANLQNSRRYSWASAMKRLKNKLDRIRFRLFRHWVNLCNGAARKASLITPRCLWVYESKGISSGTRWQSCYTPGLAAGSKENSTRREYFINSKNKLRVNSGGAM